MNDVYDLRGMAGDGSMSISAEDITGVYLAFYVRETVVKAVGNDGLALLLEGVEVIDDFAAEESGAVLKGGFIDDDLCSLSLDTLHDALYGALTEIVTIALHGETVYSDDAVVLFAGVPGGILIVIACLAQYGIGYIVLAGAIAFYYGFNEILGYILIVGQQLLGVLGQTIASITKGGIVVMIADTGVKAYSLDDGLGV